MPIHPFAAAVTIAAISLAAIVGVVELGPHRADFSTFSDDADVCIPGGPCSVGTGACARNGTSECASGHLVCSAAPGEPTAEVCDLLAPQLDLNCNGIPGCLDAECAGNNNCSACREDSLLPLLGTQCNATLDSCHEEGYYVCNGTAVVCNATIDSCLTIGAACVTGDECGEGDCVGNTCCDSADACVTYCTALDGCIRQDTGLCSVGGECSSLECVAGTCCTDGSTTETCPLGCDPSGDCVLASLGSGSPCLTTEQCTLGWECATEVCTIP